jgi:predicted DsbA family dithiol-disulfide isomerase
VRRVLQGILVFFGASLCLSAPAPVQDRIIAYFRGWYAHVPGSEVTARPTKDVAVEGLESWLVERTAPAKGRNETSLALYDPSTDEVFVGDAFGDPDRAAANKPFDRARDLPNVEASLAEMFGLPLKVEMGTTARGSLLPLTVNVRLDKGNETSFTRSGFVSKNGSALLLGQFHPLSASAAAFREKLLAESPGVRTANGSFLVTEFLDFQCDRCRIRTPDVRRAVEQKGGAVEIRFLPLVKTHEWAFAAAESAAALAAVKPELYRHYEEAMFARGEGMTPAAARELANDIAEAGGAKDAFSTELSSGRARTRVARDVTLAMRLGIISTPAFVYRGTYVPGERGALETFLWESVPSAKKPTPRTP